MGLGFRNLRSLKVSAFVLVTQRAPYPLIKEYTLNHNIKSPRGIGFSG